MRPNPSVSTFCACHKAIPVLDFLHLESPLFPHSPAYAGAALPATSMAQLDALLLLQAISQSDASPALCSLQQLGVFLTVLDSGFSESSSAIRSSVQTDLLLLSLRGVRLGFLTFTCDCWSVGPLLLPRSLVQSGQFLELEELKKWSIISLDLSDFYRGDALSPLRGVARAEPVLPSSGSGCLDSFTLVLDLHEVGSAPLARGSARAEVPFSSVGLSCAGASFLVLDLLHSGPSPFPRSPAYPGVSAATSSFAGLGALPLLRSLAWTDSLAPMSGILCPELHPSALGLARMGSVLVLQRSSHLDTSMLVLEATLLDSSLLLRSFGRLDVTILILNLARAEFSMFALDFLLLGLSTPPRSLCRLDPVTLASSTSGLGPPPPSQQLVWMSPSLLLLSRANLDFLLAVLDMLEFGAASPMQSTTCLGFSLLVCRLGLPDLSLLVLDLVGSGPSLFLRNLGHSGPAMPTCRMSCPGSLLFVLDFLQLESPLPLRSLSCAAAALSIKLHRVEPGMPAPCSKLLGPSPSIRSFA
ncbi:Lsm7 [Symbiodinium natans]|uniref:Lsm7 protein n=1 Tax=Symbiodinium natans TaxID=878477 RepID=A0A812NWJ1_9DINO|nr:Lsm7 [Symbiodinium natans]